MQRSDGRQSDQLRPVIMKRNFLPHAEGSIMVEIGNTKVICTATVDEKVPNWLRGSNQGWITAEYGMLPRSTEIRMNRESSQGRIGGRTHEIQRLIGRSLRSVVNLKQLPEVTIWMDCDVIQADGGTRTASITGAFVALYDALQFLKDNGKIAEFPLAEFVAAVSVGIVDGEPLLDLCYAEDCNAQVDMNVVMTGAGHFIEVQGTAEHDPFSREEMDAMLNLAQKGVFELISVQRRILAEGLTSGV